MFSVGFDSMRQPPKLDDIRQRLAGKTEHLWWTYRFFDEVVSDSADMATEDDKSAAVECFLVLAIRDPAWAAKQLGSFGPESYRLAMLLREGRLESALARVRLPSVKDDAMLRA